MTQARVILADDHDVVRGGARAVLSAMEGVEVVAEARDGLAAISAVKIQRPDLILLDAAMPHAKGIEVFMDARRWSSETKCLTSAPMGPNSGIF